MKKAILFLAVLNMAIFAQEPEKFAVYVSGAGEAGVNKSMSDKLAIAISNGGQYAEIGNPAAFYKDIAKKGEIGAAQIAEIAKRHGASFLCAVSMTEALGAYSISARMIRTDSFAMSSAVSIDRPIKTLEDLTSISSELAAHLLSAAPAAAPADTLPPADTAAADTAAIDTAAAEPAAAAEPPQCEETHNINELLAKIQNGFPAQLGECANKLAKDIALSKVPFSKTPAPEPKSYLTQCAMDGVKGKLPEGFPGIDKAMEDIQKFLQTVLNTALAGGVPNPAALLNAASDMSGLLNSVKNLGADNPCVVDEPYEPPEEEEKKAAEEEGGEDSDGEGEKKFFTFGIRIGMNWSHLYAEYNDGRRSASGTYGDRIGFQAGVAFDFAASEAFHIQPGIMYIQKGAEGVALTSIEIPLLLSLKFSALRINAGPYFGGDIGISSGLGFDIGKFYMGMFYDYGLTRFYNDSYSSYSNSRGYIKRNIDAYNRTLGFNIGANL